MAEDHSRMHGFSEITETVPTGATRFRSAKVAHLFAWWSRQTGTAVPLRARFDIVDHAPIITHVFLIECLPDGDFRTRIIGETARALIEPGRRMSVLTPDDPDENRRRLHDRYSFIRERKVPLFATGRMHFRNRPFQVFEALDCPLSSDGVSVTAIIGVIDLIQPPTA